MRCASFTVRPNRFHIIILVVPCTTVAGHLPHIRAGERLSDQVPAGAYRSRMMAEDDDQPPRRTLLLSEKQRGGVYYLTNI